MKSLRKYGEKPYSVAVLHGGPGAPGEVAPIAREIAKEVGILEPFQSAPSIDGQVEELEVILNKNGQPPFTLIGYSWGAWLASIFAVRYPSLVKKLILVGSGPFEAKYAEEITEKRLSRLSSEARARFDDLNRKLQQTDDDDQDDLLGQLGRLLSKADIFDPLPDNMSDVIEIQREVFQHVWPEAAQLRESGQLLEMTKEIKCPVVAIHGEYDPHPYQGVEKPLSRTIEKFRFLLLGSCGHTPWKEKMAVDKFYKLLKKEI